MFKLSINWFSQVYVYHTGNVATFEIDGEFMLIGYNINTNYLYCIVTGDWTFFYDMNALGIQHNKKKYTIFD